MKRAGQAIAMLLPIAALAALGYFIARPNLLGASPSLAFTPGATAKVTAGAIQRGPCGHEHQPAFYIGLAPGNDWQAKLNAFTAAGVRPSVIETYVRFGTVFDWTRYCQITRMGAIPLIQLNPVGFPTAAIAGGQYDPWLRSYARSVSRFQNLIALSFAPEMNGNWYHWGEPFSTPAAYIAAWRHVHTVFARAHATNVIWLWDVDRCCRIGRWWPGGQYVNWIGIDGYYRRSSTTFQHNFQRTITEIRSITGKPILIAETGIVPGINRIAQINGLIAGARQDGLLGLVWFDSNARRRWRIDQDPAALAALRKGNS
jgi:hypothetical protein